MARAPSNTPRRTRAKAEPAPTTPDPIEIAMEAEAGDTAPDSPARRLLIDQGRLVRWQIASERMGLSLRALLVCGVLAATIAFVVLVWSAARTDGLVVEPFATPPSLTERGLTGPVIAAEVLNQIGRLDREANNLQSIALSDSWSADSRVEIPQTGVSLGELDRLLRRRFGHETRIVGEVVLAREGLVLTARAGASESVRAEGSADDLPRMAEGVAEQLLGQARPALYGRLLIFRGRPLEHVEPVLRRAVENSRTDAERVEALMNLGGAYLVNNSLVRAREAQREALRLSGRRPNRMVLADLSYTERALGHHEEALRLTRAASRGPEGEVPQALANEAEMTGDFARARALVDPAGVRRLRGYLDTYIHRQIAAQIGLHDTSAARARLPVMRQKAAWPARGAGFQQALLIKAAVADENWPALLDLTRTSAPQADLSLLETPSLASWRAFALAKVGRLGEARVIAAALPTDCDPCLRIRAKVAEMSGDRAAADLAFAQAIRQAPSFAFAGAEYAAVLLERGDTAAAVRQATVAARLNPRFADAREVLGETRLAQGDGMAAVAEFEAAAKLAPRWGRLHLKWGEALAKLGKADEARAKWRAAATMDLSPADRAALKAHGV